MNNEVKRKVAIARGDGIGPEIMDACLDVLEAAKCDLEFIFVEIGEAVYKKGFESGISDEAWDKILGADALLKGPITTPQGGGYKSLNVTLRKGLGLFANIRPCVSYHPFAKSLQPKINCIIFRENEEDLYAGIEYRQSLEVFHAIKLISKSGTEKILRAAFEFTLKSGRRKLTCITKDNILKLTDGYFHRRFTELGKEYPEVETEHLIVDVGSAKIFSDPTRFDVVVTLNLYGDIISDIAAEAAGSLGLAGSANIGEMSSMFEAVHGSAPDIAGKNIANPSGLLNAAIYMLGFLNLNDKAELIQTAWLKTLEDGVHTADIQNDTTKRVVGTKEFAKAVISNLGHKPAVLKSVQFPAINPHFEPNKSEQTASKFEGVDIFITCDPSNFEQLCKKLSSLDIQDFQLKFVSNRGLVVWPKKLATTTLVDQFRARFSGATKSAVPTLLQRLHEAGVEVTKHECLFSWGDQRGYSLAQGEN